MITIPTYFIEKEIACPCCGFIVVDTRFLEMMYALRTLFNRPLNINSWCRCEKHNKEVGSTSKNHTRGKAADIRCVDNGNGWMRQKLMSCIIRTGFKRIGIHENFIHVDNMELVSSIWIYKK